jgi:hypothetical protein
LRCLSYSALYSWVEWIAQNADLEPGLQRDTEYAGNTTCPDGKNSPSYQLIATSNGTTTQQDRGMYLLLQTVVVSCRDMNERKYTLPHCHLKPTEWLQSLTGMLSARSQKSLSWHGINLYSKDSVAQCIRRWSTEPEILGSIPSGVGVVRSCFFFVTTQCPSIPRTISLPFLQTCIPAN